MPKASTINKRWAGWILVINLVLKVELLMFQAFLVIDVT